MVGRMGVDILNWVVKEGPLRRRHLSKDLKEAHFTRGVCIVCNRENLEPSQMFIHEGTAK